MIDKINTREWSLLVILFLAEFTRGAFSLTFLPVYAVKHLEISIATIGLVVSAHYLIETIFKGIAGMLFDRHGRIIVITGLLAALTGILGLIYTQNTFLLISSAAVFGLGISPLWLAIIRLVAPVDMPGRASRMGLIFAFWLGGMGSGPVLINFAISYSYNLAVIILLVLFVSAVLVSFWALPRPPATGHRSANASLLSEMKRLAGLPAVTRILLPGMFLQTLAASLLLPILPIYADEVLGLSHNQYALLLTSGGAAALLFLYPMGKLVDRMSLKILLTTGFALSAFFLFTLTLSSNLYYLFLFAALVGVSYALVLPAWNALLARVISTEMQATGWGIFGTIEGLGIGTGPALGGTIAGLLGPQGTIYCSSLILTAMALFYLLYPMESSLLREE